MGGYIIPESLQAWCIAPISWVKELTAEDKILFANSVLADEELDVEAWHGFIKAELLFGREYSL